MSDDLNTNDTTTSPIVATAAAASSLSSLLAERARERDEMTANAERERQRERQAIREAAGAYAEEWMRRHISPELRAALNAVPACEDSRINDYDRPQWNTTPESWAACILLDLSSAPEIDPDATPEDHLAGRWILRRAWTDDSGEEWEIHHRPQSFTADMGIIAGEVCADNGILDALLTYPAWRKTHSRA